MSPDATVIDAALLANVQGYLACQLSRIAPDALLTQAWEQFYDTHDSVIRGYVKRAVISSTDIDDIVQEVWSAVIAHLRGFRWEPGRPGVRDWLYTLVRNKCLDALRAHQRRHSEYLAEGKLEEHFDKSAEEERRRAERNWRREVIRVCLERLRPEVSPKSFAIIHMQFQEGIPAEQIAKQLGLTLEEVRYRRYRTLRKLRRLVHFYMGDDFPKDAAKPKS